MSDDILGTCWDQCRSLVQYSFTSTETRRLVRTDRSLRPPRLSHISWTMFKGETSLAFLLKHFQVLSRGCRGVPIVLEGDCRCWIQNQRFSTNYSVHVCPPPPPPPPPLPPRPLLPTSHPSALLLGGKESRADTSSKESMFTYPLLGSCLWPLLC